jgi:hypothetical protein
VSDRGRWWRAPGGLWCLLAVACRGEILHAVDGTASVGGKPVKITGCDIETLSDPARAAVVITLETGLRYRHDPYAGPRIATKDGEWTRITCERTSSTDRGGDDWATGKLGVTCAHPDGAIVIDATFDCGTTRRPSNRKD